MEKHLAMNENTHYKNLKIFKNTSKVYKTPCFLKSSAKEV